MLVEGHEGISHLIVLTGFSFAVGANTFDSVGGFAGIEKMMARYKTELAEELGVPDLKIKQVHNLGRIHPDRGLSNECPAIFAGVVDASQASRIVQGTSFNPDPFEMRAGPLVVPVENLWGPQGLIEVSTDAFFHAAVLRAMNRGLLPTPSL